MTTYFGLPLVAHQEQHLISCTQRLLHTERTVDCDLNLPQADLKGDAEKASRFQAFVNNLFCDNGYNQALSGPTRGEALLDIYPLKPEISLISCNILTGISDHDGVLLKVERDDNCREPEVERIVPVYQKTDVLGLQAFLRGKFNLWAGNGSCVEEIWKSYKDIILEGIKRYVAQKIMSKNPDPEYYNEEVKRLKVKMRKMYSKRKFGQPYQADLKRLSKELTGSKEEGAGNIFTFGLTKRRQMLGRVLKVC